jgi:WD40 repeat protein
MNMAWPSQFHSLTALISVTISGLISFGAPAQVVDDSLDSILGGGAPQYGLFTPDGSQIVTDNGGGKLTYWDLATGTERQTESIGYHFISNFSPDGSVLASVSSFDSFRDPFVTLIDSDTLAVTTIFDAQSFSVPAFSSDGSRLTFATDGFDAVIVDAATGVVQHTLTGHTGFLSSAVFSPDGSIVVTGSADGTAKTWDATTGLVVHTLEGHTAEVENVAFSPDGSIIATASQDGTAKLWNSTTGDELRELTGHTGNVLGLAFSPSDSSVIATSADTIKLWDIATGTEQLTITGDIPQSGLIRFSPDGASILASVFPEASSGSPMVLLDVSDGEIIHSLSPRDTFAFRYAADGSALAAIGFRRGESGPISDTLEVQLWDPQANLDPINTIDLPPDDDFASIPFALSPNASQFIMGNFEETAAALWSATSGEAIDTLIGHSDFTTAAIFSPDGAQAITAGRDNTALLWSTAKADPTQTFAGHTDIIWTVDFSPSGTEVVTGSSDGTAIIWDVATGDELHTLDHSGIRVVSVAYSPNGDRIATGDLAGDIRIWSPDDGALLGSFTAHSGAAIIAFSPTGSLIASITPIKSTDRTLRLWDAFSGELLQVYESTELMLGLAFDPSGGQLAVLDASSVLIWNLPTYPSVVHVAPDGENLLAGGSEESPWRTVGYAISRVAAFASEDEPITIQLAPGTYADERRAILLRPHLRIDGGSSDTTTISYFKPEDTEHFVVIGSDDTRMANVKLTYPGITAEAIVLVLMDDVAMELSGVTLDGKDSLTTVGLLISGEGSNASVVRNSVITRLGQGIQAIDSQVLITRNEFSDIRFDAISVRPPDTKQNGETPRAGDEGDIVQTAFNRFRDIDGFAIRNVNASVETQAELNDWGVYTEEEIQAWVDGPVDFLPYIGTAISPAAVAAQLLDTDTADPIPASRAPEASITELTATGAFDVASGLILFSELPGGQYTMETEATGYTPATTPFTLAPTEILGLPIELALDGPSRPTDVNNDGAINAVDVQLVINGALGIPVAFDTDVNGDSRTDAIDVQRVINAALGV